MSVAGERAVLLLTRFGCKAFASGLRIKGSGFRVWVRDWV